jgi:hypothetical protein
MSQPHAKVRTADLEEALDYLEGLLVILRQFHDGAPDHDQRAQLVVALMSMDSHGMNWEPLRYEAGVGMGWAYMAENVGQLRERLMEGYGNAAL